MGTGGGATFQIADHFASGVTGRVISFYFPHPITLADLDLIDRNIGYLTPIRPSTRKMCVMSLLGPKAAMKPEAIVRDRTLSMYLTHRERIVGQVVTVENWAVAQLMRLTLVGMSAKVRGQFVLEATGSREEAYRKLETLVGMIDRDDLEFFFTRAFSKFTTTILQGAR